MRTDHAGHAAGHLAHWSQQRQAPRRIGDGLIGDAGGAGSYQAPRLLGIGGQVQIGKERLLRPQHGDFTGLRFLHLDHQFAFFKNRGGGRDDLRARGSIGAVGQSDAGPGAGLHEYLMAAAGQFANTFWRQADAEFQGLDFPNCTNTHGCTPD